MVLIAGLPEETVMTTLHSTLKMLACALAAVGMNAAIVAGGIVAIWTL